MNRQSFCNILFIIAVGICNVELFSFVAWHAFLTWNSCVFKSMIIIIIKIKSLVWYPANVWLLIRVSDRRSIRIQMWPIQRLLDNLFCISRTVGFNYDNLSLAFDVCFLRQSEPESIFYGGEVRGESAIKFEDQIGTEVKHKYEVSHNQWSFFILKSHTKLVHLENRRKQRKNNYLSKNVTRWKSSVSR